MQTWAIFGCFGESTIDTFSLQFRRFHCWKECDWDVLKVMGSLESWLTFAKFGSSCLKLLIFDTNPGWSLWEMRIQKVIFLGTENWIRTCYVSSDENFTIVLLGKNCVLQNLKFVTFCNSVWSISIVVQLYQFPFGSLTASPPTPLIGWPPLTKLIGPCFSFQHSAIKTKHRIPCNQDNVLRN